MFGAVMTAAPVHSATQCDRLGALRIPRGMIEFAADDTSKLHNENLNKEDRICLICAAGGQAALAGKTMVDMGYTNVVNVGGFADWQAAGGETEE